MAFNYLKEKAAFDTQWKRIEAWYRRENMSEAAIAEMKAFDWEEFKRTRINSLHETELNLEFVENLADKSVDPSSRYWWIEEIEDEEVLKNVRRLSDEELCQNPSGTCTEHRIKKGLAVKYSESEVQKIRVRKLLESIEKRNFKKINSRPKNPC